MNFLLHQVMRNHVTVKEKKKKMYFEEKDIELCIDGMGIVFFSPKTTKDIPEGMDFFNQEYSAPADVSAH